MKPRSLIFAATVVVSGAHAQITNNLTAYWNFDGNANNHASASGGAPFNGTLSGGATTSGGAIKVGSGSLNLDGANDYVDVTTNVNVNLPWTVSAWFRSDIAPLGAARSMIYESVGTTTGIGFGMSYGIREGTPASNTNFQLFSDLTPANDGQADLQIADTSTSNTWHHIVTTCTPATATVPGSIIGYLDGVQRYTLNIPAGSSLLGDTGFHIGTYRNADGRWFDGAIDEVGIWQSTSGAGDAYTIYNLGDKGFALNTPTRIKDDNLTALNLDGSWSAGGPAPTAADYITFDSVFTQPDPLDTGGNVTAAGLRVTSGSGLIQFNNTGGYIELGALGVNMAGASRDLFIENLHVSASQRWNIASGRTFTVGTTSSLADPHVIDKWGAGTAIILGDLSRSAATTITAGTLQVGDATTTGSLGSGPIVNNGSLVFNRSNEAALANAISGTGNLFQNGSGTLVMTAATTFVGSTDVLAGSTLRLENSQALQSSNLITGGVEFDDSVVTNAFTLGGLGGSGLITLSNNAIIPSPVQLSVGNNNSNTTFSGTLSGTGGITKIGTGTLTLNSANTYAGGTTISSRRINAGDNGALGSGAVTVGEATSYAAAYASGGAPFLAMTSTGAATLANDIVLPNPPSTAYYALQKLSATSTTGTNLELSGDISGGGSNMILQLDSATAGDSTTSFTLAGTNTMAGQIRLNRGCIILTNAASLGTANLFVQTNGNATDGNIRFTNSFTLPNNIIFGTNSGNTINTGSNNVELSGVVSGSAAWTKVNGGGKLTLSGNNSGTGSITINAGTLSITGTIYGGVYNDRVITIGSGATLELETWGYDDTTGYTASLGGLTANATALVINGGTIRMTGTTPTSYHRGFTVNATGATLEAGADSDWTLASTTAPVYNGNPQLTLTGSGNGRFEKPFTGTGTLVKSGTGTWTLAGTNTHTGNTFVDQGTLRLESAAGRLTFSVNGNTNNAVTGEGTARFDAGFFIDLSAADLTDGNIWTLVDMENGFYEDDFAVNSSLGAFTRTGPLHSLTEGDNTWTFNEGNGTLELQINTGNSYAAWIDGFFEGETNPDTIGATADPDNDGIANAVEFVLGGNPENIANTALLPEMSLVSDPGAPVPDGDYFRFTFPRADAATDAGVLAFVEFNSLLSGTWTQATHGIGGVSIIETPDGEAPGIDKVEVFIPRGSNTELFGRLGAMVP